MKTIKFRGKRIDNGEWVYGDLLHIAGGCLIYFGSDTETSVPNIEERCPIAVEFFKDEIAVVDPNTIGQFTGLYDKDGKEIYEGDFVCYDYCNCNASFIGIVKWYEEMSCFALYEKTHDKCPSEMDWLSIEFKFLGESDYSTSAS